MRTKSMSISTSRYTTDPSPVDRVPQHQNCPGGRPGSRRNPELVSQLAGAPLTQGSQGLIVAAVGTLLPLGIIGNQWVRWIIIWRG